MKAMIIYTESWDDWEERYTVDHSRVLLFDDMDITEMSDGDIRDSFGLCQNEHYAIVPFLKVEKQVRQVTCFRAVDGDSTYW